MSENNLKLMSLLFFCLTFIPVAFVFTGTFITLVLSLFN